MRENLTVDSERLALLERTSRAMRAFERATGEANASAQSHLERLALRSDNARRAAERDPTLEAEARILIAQHAYARQQRVRLADEAKAVARIAGDFSNLAGMAARELGRQA